MQNRPEQSESIAPGADVHEREDVLRPSPSTVFPIPESAPGVEELLPAAAPAVAQVGGVEDVELEFKDLEEAPQPKKPFVVRDNLLGRDVERQAFLTRWNQRRQATEQRARELVDIKGLDPTRLYPTRGAVKRDILRHALKKDPQTKRLLALLNKPGSQRKKDMDISRLAKLRAMAGELRLLVRKSKIKAQEMAHAHNAVYRLTRKMEMIRGDIESVSTQTLEYQLSCRKKHVEANMRAIVNRYQMHHSLTPIKRRNKKAEALINEIEREAEQHQDQIEELEEALESEDPSMIL